MHGKKDRDRDRHRTGFVDLSAFPGLSVELVRNYIEAQIEQIRTLGFDVENCLIDLGGGHASTDVKAP